MLRWLSLAVPALAASLWTGPAGADSLVAARTIQAGSVLSAADLSVSPNHVDGTLSSPEAAIGLEARNTLYRGRPIRASDLGTAAVIGRNDIVILVFRRGALTISTEGRALGRAGIGEQVRVLSLSSRQTVTGIAQGDGRVLVSAPAGS